MDYKINKYIYRYKNGNIQKHLLYKDKVVYYLFNKYIIGGGKYKIFPFGRTHIIDTSKEHMASTPSTLGSSVTSIESVMPLRRQLARVDIMVDDDIYDILKEVNILLSIIHKNMRHILTITDDEETHNIIEQQRKRFALLKEDILKIRAFVLDEDISEDLRIRCEDLFVSPKYQTFIRFSKIL